MLNLFLVSFFQLLGCMMLNPIKTCFRTPWCAACMIYTINIYMAINIVWYSLCFSMNGPIWSGSLVCCRPTPSLKCSVDELGSAGWCVQKTIQQPKWIFCWLKRSLSHPPKIRWTFFQTLDFCPVAQICSELVFVIYLICNLKVGLVLTTVYVNPTPC